MLQPDSVSAASGDTLARLDQLVQRAQRKLGSVTGPDPAPSSAAPEEMDFADPEVLGQFLGQVTAAQDDASPFAHHELDPERVARLLAE